MLSNFDSLCTVEPVVLVSWNSWFAILTVVGKVGRVGLLTKSYKALLADCNRSSIPTRLLARLLSPIFERYAKLATKRMPASAVDGIA